jgi:hypothetical protein
MRGIFLGLPAAALLSAVVASHTSAAPTAATRNVFCGAFTGSSYF